MQIVNATLKLVDFYQEYLW